VAGYRAVHKLEERRAVALMDELAAEADAGQPAVKQQASRLWADLGIAYFTQERVSPALTGRDFCLRHKDLTSAYDAWQKAVDVTPGRRDCAVFLGVVESNRDIAHPTVAERRLAAVLFRLADRPLQAYVFSAMADAYLAAEKEAGRSRETDLNHARRFYAQSYDVYNLPKKINIHAQKALGGL
jgi:hypothetical protein